MNDESYDSWYVMC